MTRTERAIAILKDAEKAFRLEPDKRLSNNSGLCWYIDNHKLSKRLTKSSCNKLIDLIFINISRNWGWWFCEHKGQPAAWAFKTTGYNSERADFCLQRIEELEH